MIEKELLNRMINFLEKIPPTRTDFLEKYLEKLRSENAIGGYRFIGTSRKIDMISANVQYKGYWYRISFYTDRNMESFEGLAIINHDDDSDNYLKMWK